MGSSLFQEIHKMKKLVSFLLSELWETYVKGLMSGI